METGTTGIGEVIFDWKEYLNIMREKVYPMLLWSMGGATFSNNIHQPDPQNLKEYKITLFGIAAYDPNTQDKIEVWDALETEMNDYLNNINSLGNCVFIKTVDRIAGEYIPEGIISADREIGIMYKDMIIQTFCDE
jgi:hypothetical protein